MHCSRRKKISKFYVANRHACLSLPATCLLVFLVACSREPSGESNELASARVSSGEIRAAHHSTLNDTGITWAGNFPADNNEDCKAHIHNNAEDLVNHDDVEGDLSLYQDCMHGRDKGGVAGFSFRKLDEHGMPLDSSATSWRCVKDETTGLIWEVKDTRDSNYGNSSLHDGDDVFTWYSNSSTENGGAVGDWSQHLNVCHGFTPEQPATFCNIEEYVRRVNEATLCGFNDWRVPTRFELENILAYGRTPQRIDETFFPDIRSEFYWTASASATDPSTAWAVNFGSGKTAVVSRQSSFPVRLVRNSTSKPEASQ